MSDPDIRNCVREELVAEWDKVQGDWMVDKASKKSSKTVWLWKEEERGKQFCGNFKCEKIIFYLKT